VLAPTAIGGWLGAAGSVAELLVLAAVAVFAVARSIE
jgi:hypothetical protein